MIISRWSSPKKPHLKPKPRADDDSASNEKLASFNWSLANPSFNFWYSELSTGNNPQNTTGLLGLKPGKASLIGFNESQIVSPTLVSERFFIPVIINPISVSYTHLTLPPILLV